MSQKAEKTGMDPTVLVAMEEGFPAGQRIISDDLAYELLPAGMKLTVKLMVKLLSIRPIRNWMINTSEKDIPGAWSGILARKRYIDDKLTAKLSAVEAVVNLGAGFDTRLYRLPGVSKLPVWEIDQQNNIRLKQKQLQRVFNTFPPNTRLVENDFDKTSVEDALLNNGYSFNMKTFFIEEGVTQYLTESAVNSIFENLRNTQAGSLFVFTYVRRDFIEGKSFYGWEKGYEKYVLKDKIWLSGKNPEEWPSFLKQYGWKVKEDIGAEELERKYTAPVGRAFGKLEVERIIFAEKE